MAKHLGNSRALRNWHPMPARQFQVGPKQVAWPCFHGSMMLSVSSCFVAPFKFQPKIETDLKDQSRSKMRRKELFSAGRHRSSPQSSPAAIPKAFLPRSGETLCDNASLRGDLVDKAYVCSWG